MKTCPKCAERIQPAATICRFCQAEQPPQAKAAPNRVGRFVGIIGGFFLFTIVVAQCSDDKPPAPPREKLAQATVAECTKAVEEQIGKGVVYKRPSPNRLNVDELQWAMMMAEDKNALMALLACSTHSVKAADLEFSEYVVIYGARSGKRLAMLTSVGVQYE